MISVNSLVPSEHLCGKLFPLLKTAVGAKGLNRGTASSASPSARPPRLPARVKGLAVFSWPRQKLRGSGQPFLAGWSCRTYLESTGLFPLTCLLAQIPLTHLAGSQHESLQGYFILLVALFPGFHRSTSWPARGPPSWPAFSLHPHHPAAPESGLLASAPPILPPPFAPPPLCPQQHLSGVLAHRKTTFLTTQGAFVVGG